MKSFLLALTFASINLPCFAEETAPTNSISTNTINIGAKLNACYDRDLHPKSNGSIFVSDHMQVNTVAFLKDAMNGRQLLAFSHRGYPETTANVMLVLYEPANKSHFDTHKLDDYILNLCTLALANEATVVLVDFTNYKEVEKKIIRETILENIGGKMLLRKSGSGEQLDLTTLLNERQLNTIGLIALDAKMPEQLTPIHSSDAEYDKVVGGLIKRAFETYNGWQKEDAERKAKGKTEK